MDGGRCPGWGIADAVLGRGKWVPPRIVVMVEAVVDVGREWMASLLRFREGIAREWHNLGSLRVGKRCIVYY
jgi:hypothetical protein